MAQVPVKQTRDPMRRQAILDAALSAFTELGYEATTLAIICKRSGASVGSVYHFFPGKAEIVLALVQQAIAGWAGESGASASDPAQAPVQPKAAIQASVRGLLQWADKNYALFRFMEEMRAKAGSSPEFSAFTEVFSAGQKQAELLYATWVENKQVKEMNWPIAYALMTGPTYHYLRTKPAGQSIPPRDIDLLTAAAWEAVRAT